MSVSPLASAIEKSDPEAGAGLSARAIAYRHLLGQIRSGSLTGGTHIAAETVAQALGLSRMPVREALRQLASEGFVTLRSNRGAVVTPLGAAEISELYEMRAVLEGLAMRSVAQRIDAPGLAEAEIALERISRSLHDVDWFVQAHDQFHDALARYCNRPRLVSEITRIRSTTEPYLRITLRMSPTAISNTVREHAEVLEAVRSGDPDVAESAMRKHILDSDIAELLDQR
ncbi:MAG: GntR family transcriptional regulator [Roseitalea sp.]|jgi:DNA-binding GntR family transcriptional regulator|nr:GntR family transcriptional regulator [Roseitalea sp.]MBO6723195.1 GntR family transcriptional regulator [Roseitalea sp.]MBO6745266.1 GntR family transcriptional regulator [Roseitalea sp.]